MTDLQGLLDDITLPRGIHAEAIIAPDHTHTVYTRVIIWTEYPYGRCPTCDQPINRNPGCPATVNAGNPGCPIESRDLQHQCGIWLGVAWTSLTDDQITEANILAEANELHTELTAEIAERRAEITRRLKADLADALARLAEPLDPDETPDDRAHLVRSGSEVEPGVYQEQPDGPWCAWDEDPDGSGDPIVVYPEDLHP